MKIITFDYDTTYHPAASFMDIEVDGYSDTFGRQTIWAMVDSGADATMIPLRVLEAVGASYKETLWMRGTAGGRIEVDLYFVAIRLGSQVIHGLHVIGTPANQEAVIGRDVLNQLVVTLNGPAAVTEIVAD